MAGGRKEGSLTYHYAKQNKESDCYNDLVPVCARDPPHMMSARYLAHKFYGIFVKKLRVKTKYSNFQIFTIRTFVAGICQFYLLIGSTSILESPNKSLPSLGGHNMYMLPRRRHRREGGTA